MQLFTYWLLSASLNGLEMSQFDMTLFLTIFPCICECLCVSGLLISGMLCCAPLFFVFAVSHSLLTLFSHILSAYLKQNINKRHSKALLIKDIIKQLQILNLVWSLLRNQNLLCIIFKRVEQSSVCLQQSKIMIRQG